MLNQTAATTLALNSAYVYGTSGSSYAAYFMNSEDANLTDFWCKVSAYSGTWSSTDQLIRVEVREGLNGSNIPGTTLTGTFNVSLSGSPTGWVKTTLGSPITLTGGKFYWLIVGDPDGGATNFVTMIIRLGTAAGAVQSPIGSTTFTSTAGFSAAGTTNASIPSLAWQIGSNMYGGQIFDTSAIITSGTYERGLRFKPNNDMTLIGVSMGSDQSTLFTGNTLKLYQDSASPGGTTILSITAPTTTLNSGTSPTIGAYIFKQANWTRLQAGTWYRLVMAPAASLTVPRKLTMAASASSDSLLRILNAPFESAHWIQQSASVWDDSQTTALPIFGPVLIPQNQSIALVSGDL
jgi:hypothetical protein